MNMNKNAYGMTSHKLLTTNDVIYYVKKLNHTYDIPAHMIQNLEVSEIMEPIFQNALYDIATFLAQENNEDVQKKCITSRHELPPQETYKTVRTKYHKYPASFWDHFKLAFLPAWMLKRVRVKYKKIAYQVFTTHTSNTTVVENCTQQIINKTIYHPEIPVPKINGNPPEYFTISKFQVEGHKNDRL